MHFEIMIDYWMTNAGLAVFGGLMSIIHMRLFRITLQKFAKASSSLGFSLLKYIFKLGSVLTAQILIVRWYHAEGILFYLFGFLVIKLMFKSKVKNYKYTTW